MSFWEAARNKIPAILNAAFGLAIFVFVENAFVYIFFWANIDRKIYRGCFNTAVSLICFGLMLIFAKLTSTKKDPLYKIGKISPGQAAALVIVAVGMLGFVTTYIVVSDKISEFFNPVEEALEEYRESVDRYSDTPEVIVPVWDKVLYIVTLCFIVPVNEELVFRGAVFGHLRKAFKPWTAVILSSIVFGLMHGIKLHIGYAFVCGLIITSSYYLTESIIAPVILHVIFNVFGAGIANCFTLDFVTISDETSGAVITGINMASILLMPVSVFAFAYLLVVKRRKDADAKKVAEYIASRKDSSKEDDEDLPNGDNLYAEAGEGSEADG